jgi:transcriptional regulator with XRE-family HTH domain
MGKLKSTLPPWLWPVRQKPKKIHPMKIGPCLKNLRDARALTQEQMALDLNVATSTLSRIELGRRSPSLELLNKIAQRLDLPVSEIFRAAEGHPLNVAKAQDAKAADYNAAIVQLINTAQDFPPRYARMLVEFAKVMRKELEQ